MEEDFNIAARAMAQRQKIKGRKSSNLSSPVKAVPAKQFPSPSREQLPSEPSDSDKEEIIANTFHSESLGIFNEVLVAVMEDNHYEAKEDGDRRGDGTQTNITKERLPRQMITGDKIILPPSVLQKLDATSGEKSVQYPLLFKLYCPSTGKYTHAGVLEFSAIEGTLVLPEKVKYCLGITLEDAKSVWEVTTEYVHLPKGTYVKLEDLANSGYEPRQRLMLEYTLQSYYATLTIGDVIKIQANLYRVKELKPHSGVCIIDTELSVDIVNSNEGSIESGETATSAYSSAKNYFGLLEKPEFKETELNVEVRGHLSSAEIQFFKLNIPHTSLLLLNQEKICLKVEMASSPAEGADLYVSLPPLKYAQPHSHHFSDLSAADKCIQVDKEMMKAAVQSHQSKRSQYVFDNEDTALFTNHSIALDDPPTDEWPNVAYIGVSGFSDNADFVLKCSCEERKDLKTPQTLGSGASSQAGEEKLCTNCGKYVSPSSYKTHVSFCERYCTTCEICGMVFKRVNLADHWHCPECGLSMNKNMSEKHLKMWHTPLECECGILLEREKLDKHRRSECSSRIILCVFCGNYVSAGNDGAVPYRDKVQNLTEHESYCGSRTTRCEKCNRYIKLKDLSLHYEAVHRGEEIETTAAHASAPPHEYTAKRPSNSKEYAEPVDARHGSMVFDPSDNPVKTVICCNVPCPTKGNITHRNESTVVEAAPQIESLSSESNEPLEEHKVVQGIGPAIIRKRLCGKCSAIVGTDAPDATLLIKRYFIQLTNGCGYDDCQNFTACRNANCVKMDGTSAAVRAMELSQCEECYLCAR